MGFLTFAFIVFYFAFRNYRIGRFQLYQLLHPVTREHINGRVVLHPFHDLPSTWYMLIRFWVWPLSKFIPKEKK